MKVVELRRGWTFDKCRAAVKERGVINLKFSVTFAGLPLCASGGHPGKHGAARQAARQTWRTRLSICN